MKSLEEAFAYIHDQSTIVTAMAAAEPQAFFGSFHHIIKNRRQLNLFCANPSKAYECFKHSLDDNQNNIYVMFLTDALRGLQEEYTLGYIPQNLSQWSRNIQARGSIDVFWGSCSVPDNRNLVSLGPSCCYEPEILRAARTVILEINPNIPFTSGDTVIPVADVDCFVDSPHPLPQILTSTPGPCEHMIAQHIAALVPHGATLQLGIGSIPNAIGDALQTKKNLGIHTEMINDAIISLFKSGAINGKEKTIWPGKIIGSFAYGSSELYQFLDGNPLIELHPSSIVNAPHCLASNHLMTSINTAIEVDLTGQVCSESIGHREISGVGGASDTHIGAQLSKGGRGIIALTSQTKSNQSKIVFELNPGANISISRNDIDTVVTEFGFTELRGRSVAERARGLISIAHPAHRERLLACAKQAHYL